MRVVLLQLKCMVNYNLHFFSDATDDPIYVDDTDEYTEDYNDDEYDTYDVS